ncbi:ATP-dependent DNA helicase pif1 [Folsomia candida]|uniref:ATP-dependent DNA helicase n=1 Tax=Folsomia candida TaxID=158441 RepID=A0A226D284_FOLCA|nr:ATP-dependent DNA helicase pif1 [Folsomia candida]
MSSSLEELEKQYNKSEHLVEFKLPLSYYSSFIENKVRPSPLSSPFFSTSPYCDNNFKLTPSQKSAFNIFKRSLEPGERLRLAIISGAGVGKSEFLKYCRDYTSQSLNIRSINQAFVILSFTGAASFIIHGQTVYSFFQLKKYDGNDWPNLVHRRASHELKERAKAVQVLVIDEISMISLELFGFIDKRLQVLRKNKKSFGGIPCVLVAGDFLQLLCVASKPLYTNPNDLDDDFQIDASLVFRSFKFVQLLENCRHVYDPLFNEVLGALRNRTVNATHVAFLKTRLEQNVSQSERNRFIDVPRIYATRCLVKAYNLYHLIEQQKPVLKIVPIVTPRHQQVSEEYTIYLARGEKVVLTQNLSTKHRLFNNSEGTFYGALFRTNRKDNSMPVALFRKSEDFLIGDDINLERLTTHLRFKEQHLKLLADVLERGGFSFGPGSAFIKKYTYGIWRRIKRYEQEIVLHGGDRDNEEDTYYSSENSDTDFEYDTDIDYESDNSDSESYTSESD